MGCSSSKDSKESPNLDRYFEVMKQESLAQADQAIGFDHNFAALADPEGAKRKQKELHDKLRPIIAKAFDHHDTNKNGVLDAEESKAFFEHYLSRLAKSQKEMAQVSACFSQTVKQIAVAIDGTGCQHVLAKQKLIDDAMKEYQANEGKYNEAAFSLLDTNNDGCLVKDSVTAALLPGTEDSTKFADCFPTGPTAIMKRAMGKDMEELNKVMGA